MTRRPGGSIDDAMVPLCASLAVRPVVHPLRGRDSGALGTRAEQSKTPIDHLLDLLSHPVHEIAKPAIWVCRARLGSEAGKVAEPGDLRQGHLDLAISRYLDEHEQWTTGLEPVLRRLERFVRWIVPQTVRREGPPTRERCRQQVAENLRDYLEQVRQS